MGFGKENYSNIKSFLKYYL